MSLSIDKLLQEWSGFVRAKWTNVWKATSTRGRRRGNNWGEKGSGLG